jgi:TolA-binding protein
MIGLSRGWIACILLCTSMQLSFSQASITHVNPLAGYREAVDLFEKQKFSAAQRLFEEVIAAGDGLNSEIIASARYYSALCALELFNPDAESQLYWFVAEHPESPRVKDAQFNLARHYYNERKYKKALEWFGKVDPLDLSRTAKHEYYFMKGYAAFMTDDLETAKMCFFEIKDIDTRYTAPALYYYSHIAYTQKNLETALQGFLRLRSDETFAPIVPYYVAQIYFLQGRYEKVVEYAPSLLDSVTKKRTGEVSRIIGESYYRTRQYNEAIPYLETSMSESGSVTREDRYQLGYAYYHAGELKKAAQMFERVGYGSDLMAQNAAYHLADVYLKLDDKNKARTAFSTASRLEHDPTIREDALFNYAMLTYELSYSPFNEAIKAFNEYIELFPASPRIDEAYNFLVMAYMNTRNYRMALESLDKIKSRDNRIRTAYQRVAFFRGLELYNNLQFTDAVAMFDRSLQYAASDRLIAARSYYWKGEANYRNRQYDEAIANYEGFVLTTGAFSLDEYQVAHYNLGYCYFHKKDYPSALNWFRKYASLMKDARHPLVADAYNRIGDCYFVNSTYWVAIENYEKAVKLGASDADYALFQMGISLGLVARPEKKIATLEQLIRDNPTSTYVDDALFEMGRTLTILQQPDRAVAQYRKIIETFPGSTYQPQALLQIGLIFYNQNRNEEALAVYKKVVEEFPGSPEARNALTGIRNIHVDMNDVDAYFRYVENRGGLITLRPSEQDSLSYSAAENVYMSGDCGKAIQNLRMYIQKYPKGAFLVNAHFYLADCLNREKHFADAMESYEHVIAAPRNLFTEQSLVAASRILFREEQYARAMMYFSQLAEIATTPENSEMALTGLMRCQFQTKDYQAAIATANSLLAREKLPTELVRECRYTVASSYFAEQRYALALGEFRKVAVEVNSIMGAESKYRVAEILYLQDNLDLSEKEIYDFIEKNTPQQFWMAKSFILLSDILLKKGDEFQASHTLQSIIDYYDITTDGILQEARDKKSRIDKKDQDNLGQPSDLEINLNGKVIE